jgi:ribosomal protein L44E
LGLRKPRTLADLKADPRVAHIEHEGRESGVWCASLAPGWRFGSIPVIGAWVTNNDGCITICGDTIASVCESVHRETYYIIE